MSDETSVVRTIGRYHAVEELGRGGMGIVYKAFDPVIGRTVALKTIGFVNEDAEARTLRERLYREASAAGTLTHPNIVTIYDVVEDGATTAVAMEYVEGETLGALIERQGALPLDQAVDLFAQICSALDYAGAKGIVHRDIKPANILLGADGRPKVTDFGIARLAVSGLTQTGTIMGSPSYMSPEQVRGLPLDPRSDLFSAAVVFYQMITGERPFGGDDIATTMYRIVNEPPTAVELLNPTINPSVSGVLQRALAKNPADRYASGAELVGDLRRALGFDGTAGFTSAVAPLPTGALPALPQAAARPPLVRYAAIGLGVVLAGVIGLVMLGGGGGSEDAAPPAQVATAGTQDAAIEVPGAPQPAPVPAPIEQPPATPPAARSLPGPVSTMPPPIGATAPPVAAAPSRTGGMAAGGRAVTDAPPAAERPGGGRRATLPEREPDPPVERERERPTTAPAPRPDPVEPRSAPAAPAMSPAPGDAVVRADFEGPAYAFTLFSGEQRLGRIDGADSVVPVDPGSYRLRAVNEALFLNAELGSVSVRGGERRAVPVPGLASAVFSVKGEDYTGVRILIDGRQLPGPYPAQVPRIAAGPHRIVYRWMAGPATGREFAENVTLAAGGHFIVRAVIENEQIVVQQLR